MTIAEIITDLKSFSIGDIAYLNGYRITNCKILDASEYDWAQKPHGLFLKYEMIMVPPVACWNKSSHSSEDLDDWADEVNGLSTDSANTLIDDIWDDTDCAPKMGHPANPVRIVRI